MKVEAIVPRVLRLGTRVLYSHRAASVKRDISYEYGPAEDGRPGVLDLGGEPRRVRGDFGSIEKRDTPRMAGRSFREALPCDEYGRFIPPHRVRGNGTVVELDRWVIVWPDEGEGTIIGLVHRREGIWATYTESYGDGYSEMVNALEETERWPLYEVRRTLTTRSFLVPVWAAEPVQL